MKRIVLLVFVLCGSIALFAQNRKMTLKGECSPARNGEKLYLLMGSEIPCDSAVVENGKFEFPLKNLQPEEVLVVRVGKDGTPARSARLIRLSCQKNIRQIYDFTDNFTLNHFIRIL